MRLKGRFALVLLISGLAIAGIIAFGADRLRDSAPGITDSDAARLESLGYLTWNRVDEDDIQKTGVTVYNKALAYDGINLYSYDPFPIAYLIDMHGHILNKWSYRGRDWHHVELCDNGHLLGVVHGRMLVKLDWNSNAKWTNTGRFHHDVAIAESGDIYAILRRAKSIEYRSQAIPIMDDHIAILSSDGQIKKKISIFDLLGDKIKNRTKEKILESVNQQRSQGKRVAVAPDTEFDVFHTNTVEVVERDVEGLAKRGDVLICVRNMDIIAIVDTEREEVVWSWGAGELDYPHQPGLLENNNILIFDNGAHRGYSRVLELNPLTEQIEWKYEGDPKGFFFSKTRSGAQRLPNGNTLITEGDRAHVFEITKEGEIVWEFYGQEVDKEHSARRAIYRMTRIQEDSSKYPVTGDESGE